MEFPPFVDLLALSDDLPFCDRNNQLKRSLKEAWRAESCLGDLTQANDCCLELKHRIENAKTTDKSEMTIQRSLLMTGLSLYVRATSTSGKLDERGSIQLERGSMTDLQWQDHQDLIGVRNKSLAHVDPAHIIDSRTWHKVILFAVQLESGDWRAASSSNETGIHLETLNRLCRMIPIASFIVMKKFKKRINAVVNQINQADISPEVFGKHRLDPVAAFGSPAVVRRLLSGSGNDSDAFWVKD